MENGRERPDLLSERDREDINNNIIKDVLHTDKYPDSVLRSSSVKRKGENYLVKADLSLAGRKQEISFEVRKEVGQRYAADVRLHLPEFGIKPFSALLGAIKIKPDIVVHIEIPAESISEELLA
jgi:polyisoprenoid-binding protein YceI